MAKNIEARLGSKEELLKLVEDTIDNGDSLIVAAKTDDKHMALSCMGNPAFAAKVVEQIAMQIINPVLEGKMGNKVNQLEMMAQIIKSGKKLDELIAEVEAEPAHESEEKCAENDTETTEKCADDKSVPALTPQAEKAINEFTEWLRGEGAGCDSVACLGVKADKHIVKNCISMEAIDIPLAVSSLLSAAEALGVPAPLILMVAKALRTKTEVEVDDEEDK